jgi:hypothetical protein
MKLSPETGAATVAEKFELESLVGTEVSIVFSELNLGHNFLEILG